MPPDIILSKPWVLVTLSQSQLGIQVQQGFGWEFGSVALVFQTSDKLQVGDNIIFQPEKWAKLVYGSTIYFLVEETNAAFTEIVAP
jgi:hypothetical protein